jgi:hypothetical protein
MDGSLGSIATYAGYLLISVVAIVIPIMLVELYAASKGRDRSVWGRRALLFGPSVAAILLAVSKPEARQFKACPHCGKPNRRDAPSCLFCQKHIAPET